MSADSPATAEARKVVIVDDEEDLVTLFTKMIRKWGYALEMVTSDGSELVAAIAEGRVRPDVVLMDYRLKSMNGIDAARKVVTLDPSIKIIIFSADDSPRGEALRSGFTFLPKPCSLAELKRTIGPL
jgi:two-component system chemotaxis response regulator CheY